MYNTRHKFMVLNIIFILSPLIALFCIYFWQLYQSMILDIEAIRMVSLTRTLEVSLVFAIYCVVSLTIIYRIMYVYKFYKIKENLKLNEDLYNIIISQREDIIF